jgi:hypothetical protein
MRQYRSYSPLKPSQTNGHLYYVRLKTPLGIFYKLGFTSLESVEKRLGFKETGDEALIDEVLYFVYHENAFELETLLHGHFNRQRVFRIFSAEPDMPLCGNGQSELYYEDILGLDSGFTEEQAASTRTGVQLAIIMRTCSSQEEALKQKAFDDAQERLLKSVFGTLGWIGTKIAQVFNALFGTRLLMDSQEEPSKAVSEALWMIKGHKEQLRIQRNAELFRIRKQYREAMEAQAAAEKAQASQDISEP